MRCPAVFFEGLVWVPDGSEVVVDCFVLVGEERAIKHDSLEVGFLESDLVLVHDSGRFVSGHGMDRW